MVAIDAMNRNSATARNETDDAISRYGSAASRVPDGNVAGAGDFDRHLLGIGCFAATNANLFEIFERGRTLAAGQGGAVAIAGFVRRVARVFLAFRLSRTSVFFFFATAQVRAQFLARPRRSRESQPVGGRIAIFVG